MKIDIVCFAGNSGLGHYAVSLSRALQRHAEVRLITSETMEPAVGRLFSPIVFAFRRSRNLPVDLLGYVWRVLRDRPDVLLVQAWIKAPALEIPLIYLFRALGIRCAVTVHDVQPHQPRPWSAAVLRRYYGAFDRLIVHSEAARQYLAARGITRPVAVIPHGVYDIFDTAGLSAADARARLKLADTDFVVLFFGHIEDRKGVFEFVEAAQRLSGQPGYRFVIAGGSGLSKPDTARLEAACAAAGVTLIARHVPFDDVQVYFAAADLIAMPYKEGTTSGVLKLAMAFGKPVAATPIGDVPEMVPPDAGVLVPRENLGASLAEGIARARGKAAALAEGMRRHRAPFAWDRIAAAYFAFLSGK